MDIEKQVSEYLQSFKPGVFPTEEMRLQARTKINELEDYILSLPQAYMELRDFFAHKTYAKILRIPAGVILTGEVYKERCVNILLKGKITILTEFGIATFSAPEVLVPVPGSKKVGYAHEETLWMNVFGVSDEVYHEGKVMSEYIERSNKKPDPHFDSSKYEDYQDYAQFLEENNLTFLQASMLTERTEDLISFPEDFTDCRVAPSDFHGRGLFTNRDISKGEYVAASVINGCRTPAGRYTNHKKEPNAIPCKSYYGDIYLVALRDLKKDEEVFINYRDSVRIMQSVEKIS